ncbi:MAG: GNAT family N-acetyltransferase, partial [Rickettsiales bacterium]|nr:GNAT family N-acetyltransferase [Rickettsiales bacterium]
MFNAKNIYLFETDNFQIRKAEPNNEDASICLSLNNNGLVTKYMGFPNGIGTTLDKEKSNIAKNYNSYSEKGGRMLCFLKQTGECAGYMSCGHHINKDNFDEIDYKFFPQFWGKGYGFELVSALIKYVRETIETSAGIETSPNVDNIASIRISEKCGLKKIRDVVYESNETAIKCVLMRMTKEEYFETSIYEDYRIKILSNLLKKTNGKITNDDMKRLKNALNLDNRGLLTLVKKVGNAILKMEGLNVRDNFVKNIKTAISNMSKLDEKRAKAKKAEPNTETKSRAEKLHLDKKKSKITFFGKWAIFYVARFALFTMPKLLLYSAPKHIIRRVFGGGKNVSGG